jgi:hypothetical protein
MARRPNFGNEKILSQEELHQLSESLAHLSMSGVRDFYQRAYRECRVVNREIPSARAMQELVQAWKQLRKWRR